MRSISAESEVEQQKRRLHLQKTATNKPAASRRTNRKRDNILQAHPNTEISESLRNRVFWPSDLNVSEREEIKNL